MEESSYTHKPFFPGVKHTILYDSWEQFLLNEPTLKRMWDDFIPFSWSLHPSKQNILQIAWISVEEFKGDLPTTSPIRRLQSYLELRTIEISFQENEKSKVQSWLLTNTPSFWSNPVKVF